MSIRNWKHFSPTSLRHALEGCKDYAREIKNLSVERIADQMGVVDHWTLYKWIQTGRIPANMIRPFEATCGIDFVTHWLAANNGKLLIDIPTGRTPCGEDMVALQRTATEAVSKLLDFYAGRCDASETLAAIKTGMSGLAWHHKNVEKHLQPELEL